MENQKQFEFCHRVLEEVMWGRVEGEGVEEDDGVRRKKGRKWKLFRRRKKNGKTQDIAALEVSCLALVHLLVRSSLVSKVG